MGRFIHTKSKDSQSRINKFPDDLLNPLPNVITFESEIKTVKSCVAKSAVMFIKNAKTTPKKSKRVVKKRKWSKKIKEKSLLDFFYKEASVEKQSFRLPFSSSCMLELKNTKVEYEIPSYLKISKNIYLTSKPPLCDIPMHRCKCFAASTTDKSYTLRTLLLKPQETNAPKGRNGQISENSKGGGAKMVRCMDSCINRYCVL